VDIIAQEKSGCLTAFLRPFRKLLGEKSDTFLKEDEELEKFPFFVRDDFLSEAEASFFHILKTMAGDHLVICPKVSLGDIFYVSRPDVNLPYYNKINRKHLDFLLCNPKTLKPVLAIELDDASHMRIDRMERDEFVDQVFIAAGLPLVHVPVQQAYNIQELETMFRDALRAKTKVTKDVSIEAKGSMSEGDVPFCPKCGSPMILKTAQRGPYAGKQFFGCTNFPKCKGIISVS